VVDAEVNVPAWVKCIEGIYLKATRMASKPKHALVRPPRAALQLGSDRHSSLQSADVRVQVAQPLVTILLCVSKKETFVSALSAAIDTCVRQFKVRCVHTACSARRAGIDGDHLGTGQAERPLRDMALSCVARLMWVYLFRWRDADGKARARVDALARALLPGGLSLSSSGSGASNSSNNLAAASGTVGPSTSAAGPGRADPATQGPEPLLLVVHVMAMWDLPYVLGELCLPLAAVEPPGRNASADANLNVERIALALRGTSSSASAHPSRHQTDDTVASVVFQLAITDVVAERRRPAFPLGAAPVPLPSGAPARGHLLGTDTPTAVSPCVLNLAVGALLATGPTVPDEGRLARAGLGNAVRTLSSYLGAVAIALDAGIGAYTLNEKNAGRTLADLIPKEKVA
jgi:hypothetical protein